MTKSTEINVQKHFTNILKTNIDTYLYFVQENPQLKKLLLVSKMSINVYKCLE